MDRVASEDDLVPEGDDYNKVLNNLKSYLPFIKKVIDGQDLGIQEEHLKKLKYLYEMVDSKRLSADKLKPCQKIVHSLYLNYNKRITNDEVNNMNDFKEVSHTDKGEDKTKFSEVKMPSNKSDQKKECEYKDLSKISVSSSKDNLLNSVEYLEKDNVPVIEKSHENINNSESTCIRNLEHADILHTQNDLPEFSDSRLRLNKVIGFAANASIEKLKTSDTTIPNSELAKQIFDEITKQNKNKIVCNQMLKGINMNDIDINHVKNVIENIKKTIVEPIELPPPPPEDLLELQKASVKFISSEPNGHKTQDNVISLRPELKPSSSLIPKSTSIREKLNSEINILHKIGSSNEPKQKFISSLKPGTLIDLENSKVSRSSLHIESLRPVIKSSDKKIVLPLAPEKIVSRDPRIKKKNLLNSEGINLLQTSGQLLIPTSIVPNTQNHSSSTVSSSVMLSDINLSKSKGKDIFSQQEPLVYNEPNSFRNPISQTNLQPFHKYTEYNGNPSKPQHKISKTSIHNQFKQNDYVFDKNNLSQIQVNSVYYNETTIKCCELNSNTTSMRNQKLKNEQNKQFRSFKEFREAKYGKVKHSNHESTKNKIHDCHHSIKDDDTFKNINKADLKSNNPYTSFGAVNDVSSIKSFKIPKIKRTEELVNSIKDNTDINFKNGEIIEQNMKNNLIKDNYTDRHTKTPVIKEKYITIETTKDDVDKDKKSSTIIVNNSSKGLKFDTVEDNIIRDMPIEINKDNNEINDLKEDINKDDTIEKELKTNSNQDKNLEILMESDSMIINEIDHNINTKPCSKVKKPKKYSKEKEFEKIVKEAVESLYIDEHYPRIRTRSSLKKNEESLIKSNTQKSKTEDLNYEQLVVRENNKNLGSDCNQVSGSDISGSVETDQNTISSTSKEPLEVNYSAENHFSKENTVSSSEINSTVDNTSTNINEKVIFNILAHPELMNILQDKGKITKLTKLLESSDINTNEENNLNQEHKRPSTFKLKKEKKRLQNKVKRKKKREKKTYDKQGFFLGENRNKLVGTISNDNHLNTEENIVDSSFGNLNYNESRILETEDYTSVDRVKKKRKHKKSKEKYPHFEIQDKYSCKDLKIVISKFDKNNKKSEHLNSKVSSSNDLQNSHQPTNNKKNASLKRKKPFLGPLSVKLARQKMEAELNNSQKGLVENTQHAIKTDNIIKKKKNSKSLKNFKKKVLDSQTKTTMLKEPYVVLNPYECSSKYPTSIKGSIDTTFQNKPLEAELNSITTTSTESNITDVKSRKPKPKMTELDKLHADINENCAAVLTISNVRHCRKNKLVDYVNTNTPNTLTLSKKKRSSNIDLNEDENSLEVSKEKKGKKSTFELNKNEINTKKKMSHTIVKTTISGKRSNILHPDNPNKINFNKSKKSKKKLNFNKKSSVSNLLTDEVTTEVTSKIITDDEFIDKFYFQTADNLLECKFCHYKDTGLNIVRHYKEKHKDEEVLPSRLSKNIAEILISESLKENVGFIKSEKFEDTKFTSYMPVNNCFTCVFCQNVFNDFIKFYDHITSHTGEYRYKCKMCEQIYSNEDELEKHILDHSDYDKTDRISYLLYPDPVQKTKMFGYLCSFCYFVQLDYNNIVKHMQYRHWVEDEQSKGRWSIIRVSLSAENENITTSEIDSKKLIGCLPSESFYQQIQNTESIDPEDTEDSEDQMSHISVSELIAQAKKKLQDKTISIDKLPVNSASIKEEHLDLSKLSIQLSPRQIDQSLENKNRFNVINPGIENAEYTLKEKSTKCIVAGLSCEIINSVLLYKCSVLKCHQNAFSTVVLADFFKHIELNHQFLIWNKMCDLCGDKLQIMCDTDQYYLKDALEHLISYHLVLKKDEQSTICLNEKLSSPISHQVSIQNSTTEEKPKPLMTLRVRCLPGDKLSLHERVIENVSEENIVDTFKQPSQVIFSNPFESSAHQANIDEVSDKNVPVLNPTAMDIGEVVNFPEINPSEPSFNVNLCLPLNMKVVCEDIPPNPNIYLKPGQQIVNNGEPIQNSYCLIDTSYKKSYLKIIRNLPVNVMKTPLAFNYMMAFPRLLGLYKCLDRSCTKIFSDKKLFTLHMKLHYSNMEKKKKNQIYNTEQFKKCAYCFKSFDDENSLADHIAEKYTYCKYFCSYCFYRAYEASHVLIHQSIIHFQSIPSILHLEYKDRDENSKELLLAVDYNNFILPYRCDVGGCLYESYLHDDFLKHLNVKHQQCDKFCCYICASQDNGEGFIALQPKLMISHFKLHNINVYQCIFCLHGTESTESMSNHLAMEHFEYKPLCLKRSPVSDTCYIINSQDISKIKNLKIMKLNKTVEKDWVKIINSSPETSCSPEILKKKTRKRRLKCSDVLSTALKSVSDDKNVKPADAIIITVPDRAQMTEDNSTSITLPIDNEFIILDDVNQNDMQDPLKLDSVLSETKNNEEELQQSNDDVIIIDDEEDLLGNDTFNIKEKKVPTKRKHSSEETVDQSNKVKRLAFPTVELDKLFNCKECDQTFSNSNDYHIHLNKCPFWNFDGQKCRFCSKIFKTTFNMSEHVQLHGPNRFKCCLCNLNLPSRRAIAFHMRNNHKISNLEFIPEIPGLTNLDKDTFVVAEKKNLTNNEHKVNRCNVNFKCGECSFKGNTRKIAVLHMKNAHNINDYEITPVDSSSINTREYLIQRMKFINVLMPQQQSTTMKIKRNNGSNKKASSKTKDITQDKKKTLMFSPNTIDNIPKSHIFTEPIGCSLCTYNTKVRSNLIIHLNGHTIGQDDITKEIVNPVPSMGKSELMFDKMINLSASSFDAMNTLKMKTDEINKKIVEVALEDNLKIDSYPQFISKNIRYKCSIPCTYTCITEHMLKSHILIIHPDSQFYICPHCPQNSTLAKVELNQIELHLMHHSENLYRCQYCDYIDFNRNEMRAHMRKSHLPEITNTNQSNIIVIRQMELEDINIDRIKNQAQSTASQWICNMCSFGIKYTLNEITSHIFKVHKVSCMFKCPMCQFENNDDDARVFEHHYKLNHPSVAVKCLRVFEKVTDEEKPDKQPVIAANMLEQQALESIEPSLVPPTCRGIPIESMPTNKASNKSTSKSPKKTAKNSSPHQVHKQKTLVDDFNKDDSLGYISSNGQYTCPRCNIFKTMNIEHFRDHLYKDVNYKTWKCMNCFEISDSPKKMAWHVKKHGDGSKYEKVEDNEKLKWVERVIEHQNKLFYDLKKNKKQRTQGPEQNKTVVADKKTKNSPSKKKNIVNEKKILNHPITDDDIINLLDDSDDE
ncbi:uncharacterized protein LOC112683957 isoform X4 [Sipha flava]|uniref:Uncharacterized protein LOC112683957 isoform X4 n=1 Tax=Sipha flava TaxID=143950 RepID=A0A8B8FK10_9HEMI|nr:uncharacterized protein LOC112683957 isoform X4 [Sipha flava]